MQECVYQDYGLAKDAGWEPGEYIGMRSQTAGVEQAAQAAAGKPAGGGTGGATPSALCTEPQSGGPLGSMPGNAH